MPLNQTNGAVTLDGTEQNCFASQTSLKHYATYIMTHNMGASDSLEITIYVNDPQSATERIYERFTVTGTQVKPAIFLPFVPTNSYRVTVKRTGGTFTTINWNRHEV